MYGLNVLEQVFFHLRKRQRSNCQQIFRTQGHRQETNLKKNSVQLTSETERNPSHGRFVYAKTPMEKSGPFHQIQFRTPRHSSVLCIFCVKLYFQSFMSNLNSWQLHSDLDRIPNSPWTPNPFHKTQMHTRAHIHSQP